MCMYSLISNIICFMFTEYCPKQFYNIKKDRYLSFLAFPFKLTVTMNKCRQKHPNIRKFSFTEEVSSIEWEFVDMTAQEEDIINRMHKLVGDRWALIAGRVPGRKAEEIERFWLMRNSDRFEDKRKEQRRRQNS